MKYSFSYIIPIQFLGFRFSGWQKQTNAKTLHDIVDKSLSFVLQKETYKTIGVGRTDAKVSANSYYLQLFTDVVLNEGSFIESLNSNFPADFKATSKDSFAPYKITFIASLLMSSILVLKSKLNFLPIISN